MEFKWKQKTVFSHNSSLFVAIVQYINKKKNQYIYFHSLLYSFTNTNVSSRQNQGEE